MKTLTVFMQPLSKLVVLGLAGLIMLLLSGCTVVGVNEEPTPEQRNEIIRQAVLDRKTKLLNCYDYELGKSKATGSGKVLMEWDVDEAGHAQNITMDDKASTLKIPTLTRCLTDELREIDFPPRAKGTTLHIRFPFVFDKDRPK